MAVRTPIGGFWRPQREHDHPRSLGRDGEGRAERLASWLLVYLAALVTCLTLGGSAWALGLLG